MMNELELGSNSLELGSNSLDSTRLHPYLRLRLFESRFVSLFFGVASFSQAVRSFLRQMWVGLLSFQSSLCLGALLCCLP